MTGPSDVTGPSERHERTLEAMRAALAPEPPLRLTRGGLALLAMAAQVPLRPGELAGEARGQLAVLRDRGIIGDAGTPAAHALPAVRAMSAPNVRLTAEAGMSAGRATWAAWLGPERAVVAVRADPADAELEVSIVPPGWAPAMAARWLGVGPRPHEPARNPAVVPRDVLFARLADRTTPVPGDTGPELRRLWEEPLALWGLQAQPGNFGLLVLDAGQAGHWLVETAAGTPDVTLRPRPAREVWRRIMHAVVSADVRRRAC